MDRAAVATILVLLLGVWIQPFLLGAGNTPTASNAQVILSDVQATADRSPATTGSSIATTEATTQHASLEANPSTQAAELTPARPTEPKFKVVRGEENFGVSRRPLTVPGGSFPPPAKPNS